MVSRVAKENRLSPATLEKQLEASLNTVEQLGTRTRVMNRKLGDVENVEMDQVSAQKLLGVFGDVTEGATAPEPE